MINNCCETLIRLKEVVIIPPPPIARVMVQWVNEIAPYLVSINSSASSYVGSALFKYRVYYNDINDVLQFVDLPTANNPYSAFSTSVLTNWNVAGFEIVLKIEDVNGIDYTQNSDPINEKPFRSGSYSNGFSNSYSYNF